MNDAANEALAVLLERPATAREVGNAVWNPGKLERSAFTSPATKVLRRLEAEGLAMEMPWPCGGRAVSLWFVGLGLVKE